MPNKWMNVNNIECSCMANPRTIQQTEWKKNMEYGWSRNARPQTVKAGWTTWYSNSQRINIKHAVFHVQMQCSMKPECISIRSILWGRLNKCSPTHKNISTGIVTKSFRLHPWVPTKHCCFSMQVSQFRMVFPGFTYLAKETNCLPSPAVYKASPTCPCSVKIGSSHHRRHEKAETYHWLVWKVQVGFFLVHCRLGSIFPATHLVFPRKCALPAIKDRI